MALTWGTSIDSVPILRRLQKIYRLMRTDANARVGGGWRRMASTIATFCTQVIVTESCTCYYDGSPRAMEQLVALAIASSDDRLISLL
jgi:hypothetical protein